MVNADWCEVACYPGARIDHIRHRVADVVKCSGNTRVRADYDIVVVHVGTNDINYPLNTITRAYAKLRTQLRRMYPLARLGFSAILPRLKDFEVTCSKVETVNRWIQDWVTDNGDRFLNGNKTFSKSGGSPKEFLYRDGLHPNDEGIKRLVDLWRSQLSYKMLTSNMAMK